MTAAWFAWMVACSQPPVLTVQADWTGDGVDVHANGEIQTVVVLDAAGAPLISRTLAAPTEDVFVGLDTPPGEVRVRVTGPDGTAEAPLVVPSRSAWTAEVQPVPGAGWVPARGRVEVPTWGASASLFVRFTAGPAAVDVPGDLGAVHLPAPGSRVVLPVALSADDAAGRRLQIGDDVVHLVPVRRDLAATRAALQMEPLVFPADAAGLRDLGRPADAITLPSPLWEETLATLGWGAHARASEQPWAFIAAPFSNGGAEPVDMLVSVVAEDAAGRPAPALRPRLRSADGGSDRVAVLLRVPAGGRASAVLPVFVDAVDVPAGMYTLAVTATPLGSQQEVAARSLPFVVGRGDALSSAGFLVTVLTSTVGLLWTARRLPAWLRAASTTDLMVNALFGTALFVISTATDVLAMSVGAVLGPFATVFTGVLYDAGRTVLLATLLQLQPRPGTLALSILCSWLGRGVLMGTIGPPDLIYTGAAIAVGEGFAWLSGITRGRPGRSGASTSVGFASLVLAFAPGSALLTLAGLWLHTVLYRLHFATWYVLLQVGLPGFLYVVVACGLAVPFARSLREVDA